MKARTTGHFHYNTGPPKKNSKNQPKYPCTNCKKGVIATSKSISCDLCEQWSHVRCTKTITIKQYEEYVKNSTNFSYICGNCSLQHLSSNNDDHINYQSEDTAETRASFNITSENHDDLFRLFKRKGLHFIQCNARSLLPKLSEIKIVAAKTKAAVISITESWLDNTVTNAEIHIEELFNGSLQQLNPSKSTGLDGIPSRFLRDGSSILAKPITYIVNLSITSGIVPDEMKTARVCPIFKKNSRLDVGNYRPVNDSTILYSHKNPEVISGETGQAKCLSEQSRKTLVTALIQCHFDYACSAWYAGVSKKYKDKLQVLQNKCVRFIKKTGYRSKVDHNVLNSIGYVNIENRVKQLRLNHVHNIYYHHCPNYMYSNFTKVRHLHHHFTRNSEYNFWVPPVKSQQKDTFYFNGIQDWNMLPINVKKKDKRNSKLASKST
ncbi:unnamed protein product [Mytilus edulis]|uniref:Zinc finger PHD-type domain-containing protein n=1 Tax=Mytilus edulis TaxID=6550 RepID=A0A8S3RQL7_MYTED|nr:unnamed protein product [Mytilus edulis]